MMKIVSRDIIGVLAYLLIPIVGLLFLGWRWQEIMFLYWLENISVGAVNIVKMVRAPRSDAEVSKNFFIPFFMMHYGAFTFGHGILLMVVTTLPFAGPRVSINFSSILWPWVVVLVAKVMASIFGKAPNKTAGQLLFAPYARIVPLHASLLLGMKIAMEDGISSAFAYLLVLIHALIDLTSLLVQRWNNREQLDRVARTPF